MPAVAVIQRPQALSGFIGRKEHVGGYISRMSNLRAQLENCIRNGISRDSQRSMERMV